MRTTLILLALVTSGFAFTRRVPSDYATIQSAFNAVQDGDTVLVALGTYREALTAPARPFVFKGDVIPDTGDYPRPIVDPTSLPGSDSLCCLFLPANCIPVIEDLRFRNGPAMYPHHSSGGMIVGGVHVQCAQVTARRCVFDSTYSGFVTFGPCAFDVEACRFLNVLGGIHTEHEPSPVRATDCLFRTGFGLMSIDWAPDIQGYSGSRIVRCGFEGNVYGARCDLRGQNLLLRDCVFGPNFPPPAEGPADPTLWLQLRPQGVVENNLFRGLRPVHQIIAVICACNDSDQVIIRHNRFVDNWVTAYQGSPDIEIQNSNGCSGRCNARIDSNVFDGNHGNRLLCKALFFWNADAEATGNRFHHLWSDTSEPGWARPYAVHVWGGPLWSALAGNRFDSTGLAVVVDHSFDTLDARWNWWGSPTGPYNAASNPGGLGDTIVGRVDFTPWCVDTVNCEEPNAAPDRLLPRPPSFVLSAYPNPFNSTTVIRLEVPQAEIVRVELFDVLGRKVRELWVGAVADEKEIPFDGSELASGIYFVRATNTIWNRPLISTKIVLLK